MVADIPPRKILVLLAHPSQHRSEINRPLAQALAPLPGLTLVDLYAEYPTMEIDIEAEQQRLTTHDVIIFLHPLYWYSTPAILKEWQDLVLEYGFAYGSTGNALKGKLFFSIVSAGGPLSAYQPDGLNRHSIAELFRPIEMTATLCKLRYLPPLVLYDARHAQAQSRLQDHIHHTLSLLEAIRHHKVDITQLSQLTQLNDWHLGDAAHD
ncbi:NAD(P)H-dependent oxidoreductase [Ferrimonas pelagia]|uniref:NAD(P)H-dependent oxidoreductase n=1 Tax=Ferrimonas pelagia TaxID=1177826 RepID=A0ABP9EMR5_9GAMM